MRVRIIKPFYYARGRIILKPNDVTNAPEEDAQIWLKSKMAMLDKSLDGPTETKVVKTRKRRANAKRKY